MGLAEEYARDIHENLRLYANWPWGEPAALGDYGFVNNDMLIRAGNLSDLGVAFTVRPDSTGDQVEYRSKDAIDITFTAKGKAASGEIASAKVAIGFKQQSAVFLNLADCTMESIANIAGLTPVFEQLVREKRWNPNYRFISRITRAGSSTIAISSGSKGSLVLQADAKVKQINLADASMKLGVSSESNVGLKVICRGGLTPLLGLAQYSDNPYSGEHGVKGITSGGRPQITEDEVDAWKALPRP